MSKQIRLVGGTTNDKRDDRTIPRTAPKAIRADIDVLVRNYFQLQAELEDMKRLILDHCAAMAPNETITEGVYTKSQPILDRDHAAMLAVAKDLPIPKIQIEQVDYKSLELLLKETCDPEELKDIYKPKAASIGKPRRREA